MKIALRIFAIVTLAAITIWAVGALYYSPILPENGGRWQPAVTRALPFFLS